MTDASELSFSAARDLVERLGAEIAADDGAPPRLIETAISWVLLGRTHAYKFKKPLRLPFLDFSTLAERRRLCDEELRLNRRFAPDLYLDVVEVREGPRGPSFAGTGRLLEVALRMRRFPDGALWSERVAAGALVAADIDAFALRLAAVHREAARAPAHGGFGAPASYRTSRVARSSRSTRGSRAQALLQPRSGRRCATGSSVRAMVSRRTGQRGSPAGRFASATAISTSPTSLQIGDEPTAFDCLEFDQALRWIDRSTTSPFSAWT